MRIDIKKLKIKLCETAVAIVMLKQLLRESGQPKVTYKTYRELKTLKQRATVLCSLRAHCRGKIHLQGSSVEKQAEFVSKASEEFQDGESQATAA